MEWYVILGYVLFGCFFVGMIGYSLWRVRRNNKYLMEKAKKIDPTVKNVDEARYVLQKDMLQNVGAKSDKE